MQTDASEPHAAEELVHARIMSWRPHRLINRQYRRPTVVSHCEYVRYFEANCCFSWVHHNFNSRYPC